MGRKEPGEGGTLCSVCRSCRSGSSRRISSPSSNTNPGCFHSCKCKLMHYLRDTSKASREALQSSSLLKYRKFFENT